jgi:hypothetical protein
MIRVVRIRGMLVFRGDEYLGVRVGQFFFNLGLMEV